jgi:Holliday junction resolvase RusA-like endonuclease
MPPSDACRYHVVSAWESNVSEFPVSIVVWGEAKPAGSKRAVPLGGKNPTGRWGVVDDNKQSGPWKRSVAQAAGEQYLGPLLLGPLTVEIVFVQTRPKVHFGTGRNEGIVKDSAPAYPAKKPDVLKLARAVEDALTGVVWRDDDQIVDERLAKRYGDRARVEIRVWPSEVMTVGDLVARGEVEPTRPELLFEQLSLVPEAA